MRRLTLIVLSILGFAAGSFAVSAPVLADGDFTSTSYTFPVDTFQMTEHKYRSGEGNVLAFVKHLVSIVLVLISTLAALFIVIGGIILVTSGGESSKATTAKSIIQYNIIAIAMALFSYSIMQFVTWILTNGAS